MKAFLKPLAIFALSFLATGTLLAIVQAYTGPSLLMKRGLISAIVFLVTFCGTIAVIGALFHVLALTRFAARNPETQIGQWPARGSAMIGMLAALALEASVLFESVLEPFARSDFACIVLLGLILWTVSYVPTFFVLKLWKQSLERGLD